MISQQRRRSSVGNKYIVHKKSNIYLSLGTNKPNVRGPLDPVEYRIAVRDRRWGGNGSPNEVECSKEFITSPNTQHRRGGAVQRAKSNDVDAISKFVAVAIQSKDFEPQLNPNCYRNRLK
jgi:hypothetical protein